MSRIVAALDGSAQSGAVLDWVLEHASADDEVIAMLVWNLQVIGGLENPFGNLDEAQRKAVRRVSRIVESVTKARWANHRPSVPVRIDVRHGDPVAELVRACAEVDQMVMGGFRHGIASLGSVAREVVPKASIPVTLIPVDARAVVPT